MPRNSSVPHALRPIDERAPSEAPAAPAPGLLLILHNPSQFACLADCRLKSMGAELTDRRRGDVRPTQLRVSFSVGLSAFLRYATMKSVPGLVTIISLPSNLTLMSMMKPYHTKKPGKVRHAGGFL